MQKIPLKIILALLLFLPLHFCLAQTTVKIYGEVLDAETGLPLSGANVVVEGTGIGTSTDDLGRFAIEDLYAGEYSLRVSYIGYQTATIRNVHVGMDQPSRVVFKLEPSSLLMPTLLVKAEKYADKSDVENKVVIDKNDIRRSNAQDVADLLRTIPGVEIKESSASGGRATVSIRGSQANQVLILIDGVQLTNALTGEIDLSTIPLASVERIEISKGATPAARGGGAIAGVMNIITRSNENKKLELKAGTGSFGARNFSSALATRVQDFSFFAVAEAGRSVGNYPYQYRLVDGTVMKKKRVNSDFKSKQLFATISRSGKNSQLKLMGLAHQSDRGQPGLVYSPTPFARALTERRVARLFYEIRHAGGSLQTSLSYIREQSEYRNLYPADIREKSVPPYHTENLLRQMQANVNWRYALTDRQKISLAFDRTRVRFSDMDLLQKHAPVGNASTTGFGFSLQHEWESDTGFFGRAATRTTLRYDIARIEHNASNRRQRFLNPFVGLFLSKRMIVRWQLMVNYGKAFRLPTYADLFYQQYRVRGNVNLLPEKSTSREVALTASWPLIGQGMLRLSAFESTIEDLIIWRMGSFATFSPVNTDAKITGQEIEFNWRSIGKWIDLSVFHTILNTENLSHERTTHGKELPYRPKNSTKARVQLQVGTAFAHYFIRHIGDRFVTAANTVRLPGYTVSDLTLGKSWTWRSRELLLKISVYNLTDVDYQIIENAPLPGRETRMTIEFKW